MEHTTPAAHAPSEPVAPHAPPAHENPSNEEAPAAEIEHKHMLPKNTTTPGQMPMEGEEVIHKNVTNHAAPGNETAHHNVTNATPAAKPTHVNTTNTTNSTSEVDHETPATVPAPADAAVPHEPATPAP